LEPQKAISTKYTLAARVIVSKDIQSKTNPLPHSYGPYQSAVNAML